MKPFIFEENQLIEIMNTNLCEMLNNSFDFIKVWDEQYEQYVNLLISEEKYEYCKLLEDEKFNNTNIYTICITSGNTFGNSTNNNTFGDYTFNSTFGNGTSGNTFGDYTDGNSFGNNIQGIDFTITPTPTHIYGDYPCNIFKRQDGTVRLSYYDNTDTLVVVDPTD